MEYELGPIYTKGKSYRARAEARQREYRARTISVGHGRYGHYLDAASTAEGRNFVIEEAFHAASDRQKAGKGVAHRTFENMLSSQAMCFNLFAPLDCRRDLATRVLKHFIPSLKEVRDIKIEFTPCADIFMDQSGPAGVDCDLLIDGLDCDGHGLVLTVETKFVEPEFSTCSCRGTDRERKGKEACPDDMPVLSDRRRCLYVHNRGYLYWERSDGLAVLADDAIPDRGCPFAGPYWQLWVNTVLAHAEAARRGARSAIFAVCAPGQNNTLLGDGAFLEGFRRLLRVPECFVFMDLDGFLGALRIEAPSDMTDWVERLSARYGSI